MSPSVGREIPVSMLKMVVLPAPLGPIRPTISPSSRWRLKSETALRPPKEMERPVTSSSIGQASPWAAALRRSFGIREASSLPP